MRRSGGRGQCEGESRQARRHCPLCLCLPSVGEIDGRASLGGLVVNGRIGADKVRHICNVNANFVVPVVQRPDVQRIVNVGAARRVDAANLKMPQVAPARQVLVTGLPVGRREAPVASERR